MTLVYVAGPLFNTHERRYLEEIAATLESAGYQTYLPHRDTGEVDLSISGERERVFKADLDALDACDFGVALLTGADHDSGTSLELGYLFARGKPCFGISDDVRWLNIMIWGACKRGTAIVAHIEDLLPLIERERGEA